jgi:hypothetical protein
MPSLPLLYALSTVAVSVVSTIVFFVVVLLLYGSGAGGRCWLVPRACLLPCLFAGSLCSLLVCTAV